MPKKHFHLRLTLIIFQGTDSRLNEKKSESEDWEKEMAKWDTIGTDARLADMPFLCRNIAQEVLPGYAA